MPSSLALCGYVSQRDVFFFWIWESGCQAADYFLFVEDKLDSAWFLDIYTWWSLVQRGSKRYMVQYILLYFQG